MNILVLGGSGFLGSHVADQLTLAGHHVRIFDRMPSPWLHQDQQMILGDLWIMQHWIKQLMVVNCLQFCSDC